MMRLATAVIAATGLIALAGCQQPVPAPAPETAQTPPPKVNPVERGKYLVEAVAGCDDCHTPKKGMGPNGPVLDMTRRMSGHPEADKLPPPPKPAGPWIVAAAGDFTSWAGPWGISYTANLTPDQNTGLGIWTEEMFIKAIREGKHMGTSRPILPPMPVQILNALPDEELKSIFAYLQSLAPVKNRVPAPIEPADGSR